MEDRTTPVYTAPPIGMAQTAVAARRQRSRMAPAATARRERRQPQGACR
jgi:hypothetical protein